LPELTVTPDRTGDRLEGEKVSLGCRLSQVIVPEPQVFWYKDGQQVTPNIALVDKENTLIIPQAEIHHTGNYICKAQNSEGSTSQTIYLNVQPRSSVRSTGVSLELKEGEAIILDCDAMVAPGLKNGLQIDWLKDRESLGLGLDNSLQIGGPSETLTVELEEEEDPCHGGQDDTSQYHLLPNSSLKICSANLTDVGTYQCQLTTELERSVLGPENFIFTVTNFPWWILFLLVSLFLLLVLLVCMAWQCRKRKTGKGYYGMDVEGVHNKSDIYYTIEKTTRKMQDMDASAPGGLLNQMEAKIEGDLADVSTQKTESPIFTPKTMKELSDVDISACSLGSLIGEDSFLDRGMDEDGSLHERYAD